MRPQHEAAERVKAYFWGRGIRGSGDVLEGGSDRGCCGGGGRDGGDPGGGSVPCEWRCEEVVKWRLVIWGGGMGLSRTGGAVMTAKRKGEWGRARRVTCRDLRGTRGGSVHGEEGRIVETQNTCMGSSGPAGVWGMVEK